MKVILLKEIKGLGKPDDIVEVHDGYANNYLFRQRFALEATPANLNSIRTRKKAEAAKVDRALEQARLVAGQISGRTFDMPMKCGEGGRLYGAVTAMDIAEMLELSGFKVDKRCISIRQPIKSLGEYEVDIRLFTDVAAKIMIRVVTG